MGGQTIVILGDGFCPGLHVVFGTIPVSCQLLSSHAVRVQCPPRPQPGGVYVTLALGTRQFCVTRPGTFRYISPAEPSLDLGFSRLAALVPRRLGDPGRLPREVVLQ